MGAWESKFKRVSFAGPGPYVIVSRAELFKTANVATKQLDDFRSVIQQSPRFAGHGVRMSAPDVGEEAIAITALQGKGARTLRFVSVIWRDRNVMASLSGNGFAQTMSVDDVLALARSQDRHIHDA